MRSSRFFWMAGAAALVIAFSLSSCSDNPSSDNNGTTSEPTIKPKLGSTFTFSIQKQDKDRMPTGTSYTRTFTLNDTSGTAGGLVDVYAFIGDTDRTVMRYEANGDISMYFAKNELKDVPAIWVTIPFGTMKERTDTLIVDPNYKNGSSIGLPLNVRATSTPGTDTTIALNGQDLKIRRITWEITHDYGSSRQRFTYDLWYAPKLGYFVKWDYLDSGEFFGPAGKGLIRTLTGFALM